MARPDESLIRDADLLAVVADARAKGTAGPFLDPLIRVQIAEQQKRDAAAQAAQTQAATVAALPREKRRRAIIREVFENSPPSFADVRHIHSVLAICGMPYDRLPTQERTFRRTQGNMAVNIQAGSLTDPKGNEVDQPLPFGPKARLILMHLCSEAVRQKSPTIEIADSFTGFVRDMGFSDSGGKKGPMTAFREQLSALAACSIKMSVWDGQRAKSKQFFPISSFDLWLPGHVDQQMLWPSTVTFSPDMYDSLQRHALPINARAVKAFAGSARKLDLYFWLGWRIHNINDPLKISWAALKDQFGAGFTRDRDFRTQLALEIGHLKEVFPKLPLTLTEQGLNLSPAGPEVLALPVPRRIKKP